MNRVQGWFKQPPTRNIYKWPPLFIAWGFMCYHLCLALALFMEKDPELLVRLIAVGGSELSIDYLGVYGTTLLLLVISLSALVGLLLEYHLHWSFTLAFILPQFFFILGGAGHHVAIFIEGEYNGNELSRWLIIGVLGLFFSFSVWHTISVVWRIKYWMLVSQFRSEA